MGRKANAKARAPHYSELVEETLLATTSISRLEDEHELATVQYDSDIYDAVVIAAFGGLKRRNGKHAKPVPVHPCFCFLLCIPLFVLQSYLIIFLLLDFDTTLPVQAKHIDNPSILFAGKILMTAALQLILFDEVAQSLRLFFLLVNPLSWTDIRRIQGKGVGAIFAKPAFLAPFPIVAMSLRVFIAMWVTDASLSVVLASGDVPSCIMNSLAVVFIADLDHQWWSLCSALYEFEDISGFRFKLYDAEQRRKERSGSFFVRCLGKDLDSKISTFLTVVVLALFYIYQAFVVAFAVDTNILPIARDICAWWRLLSGHSEYRLNPTVFRWGLVHFVPTVDIASTITKNADPQYNGYCNQDYAVMRISDMLRLARRHPWLPVIFGCTMLLFVVLPHICFHCELLMSADRTGPSRDCELREEVEELQEEVQDDEKIFARFAEQISNRVAHLEREVRHMKDLENVIHQVREEQGQFQQKGTTQLSAVTAEMANLRHEFQEEATRGSEYQKDLDEFQQCQNGIEARLESLELKVQSLASIQEDVQSLRTKVPCSVDFDVRKPSMDTEATATHGSDLFQSARIGAAGSVSRTNATMGLDGLSDEDLNTTQPVCPSQENACRGMEQLARSLDTTVIPETPTRDTTNTCDEHCKDLNITRPPEHVEDLNETVPPGDFASHVAVRTNELHTEPTDLDHTVPPFEWPVAGGGNARGHPHVPHRPFAVPGHIDHTVPPIGWPSSGNGGGQSAFSFGSPAGVDQLIASQVTSLVASQLMAMKEQLLSELRQCCSQAQEVTPMISANTQSAFIGNRNLESQQARQFATSRREEDILNVTTVVAAPAEPSPVHQCGIQTTPDELESTSTLQEAAMYLSPMRAWPTSPTPGLEFPGMTQQHADTRPHTRHPSYNPPLSTSASAKTLPSIQKTGQTVVLPPRMRSVGPRMRGAVPVGVPQKTTPSMSLSETSSSAPVQRVPQSGFHLSAGFHETAVSARERATLAHGVKLRPARPVSAQTLASRGGHAVTEGRSRSVQGHRHIVSENRSRSVVPPFKQPTRTVLRNDL